MFKKILLLALVFTAINQNAHSQNLYFPPVSNSANWETVSPDSLGWCVQNMDSLFGFLEQQNSKGFIVLKDGKIAIEKYFGSFTKDSIWYWASAGKTLTSFLIAKAQEEGLLKITDTSSKYLGVGWTNCTLQQENKISILNQLTMTSGLDDGVTDNHCTDKSCLVFKANAGNRWAYHNAPYTLLEKVLTTATGKPINTYTSSKISLKTGINGLWLTTGFDNVFYSRARNMARFGLLFQNRCVWNGEVLLNDTNYINQMTNSSQNINPSYGYLWWLNGKSSYMIPTLQTSFPGSLAPQAPADMFAALGKNGQVISVSRSKGLVVVRIGDAPGEFGEVPMVFLNQMWQKLNTVICNRTNTTEIEKDLDLNIYPNPTDGQLNISGLGNSDFKIEIYNAIGQLQLAVNNSNRIDVSALEKGIYLVKIQVANQSKIIKFVKE
ncbi:MAG: serine hydrolase [Bacteroidia bacterium]|nr:serine hydrolase [Bacteroidia bacterium]